MKKKTKIIIALAAACAGTLVLGACANETPYPKLAEQGYTVSVRYDMNGGKALNKDNVSIVDSYKLEDVKKGVKLLSPDDSRRQTATQINIERSGYFLAGWYAKREARTDGEGKPLDEDGNLCDIPVEVKDEEGNLMYDSEGNALIEYVSENGKSQGYSYGDPWDFEKDIFGGADYDYEYVEGEVALTLYAAWIPHFTYRIMGETVNEAGQTVWEPFATYVYNPAVSDMEAEGTLPLPDWNADTGRMDYGKLTLASTLEKTFKVNAAYSDPAKTQKVTEFKNYGSWDPETATSVNGIATYYADWLNGLWYQVNNEEQFVSNAAPNSSLIINKDLDFSQIDETTGAAKYTWPAALSVGTYTGTIQGNGFTIKGVTVRQTGAQDTRGGLFGTVASGASIEKLTFTDVTYRLEQATTTPGSYFGLFAGELQSGATISEVTVKGTLVIGTNVNIPQPLYNPDTGEYGEAPHIYDVGLVTGNLATKGIDYDIDIEEGVGIIATAEASGLLSISRMPTEKLGQSYRGSNWTTEDGAHTLAIRSNGEIDLDNTRISLFKYGEYLEFAWNDGRYRITLGETITVEEVTESEPVRLVFIKQ